MYRNLLFVLFILTLMPVLSRADWVSLNGKTVASSPRVTLVSDNGSSSVIKVDISGFNLKEFMSDGKTYQSIDLMNEIFTTEPGFPELPYIAKVLAIPDQAGVTVEILETGSIQTFKNINLPPARLSWYEGQPEPSYLENGDAYMRDEVYPSALAKVEPPSVFRDFRIARVSVFPLRYIPALKELQAVSSITIRVNYGQGAVVNPKTTPKKSIAPSFSELYKSFIFNYESVLDRDYEGKVEGHEVMLCIMPDEFIASFQIYADWKRESGTDIHVTKFSDIGANASNPDIIKNHIADAYHNWAFPPTYVLMVGDDGVFPKKIVTYPDYSFPNEDYFVEIDGNDYFPEMMIGRFTNQGDYRMQVMINKFLLYEKTPYTINTNWFKKGIVCSNNQYDSQIITKRFAAGEMLNFGGFTSVDTMMSDGWGYNCTYDLNDVKNALNDGRSYLNYRGEGWSDGWHANCYEFSVSDVTSLNNGQKFTFVTSIGCGVGMFDTYGGNCFGEEWIEMGSLTAAKGAAAFIGPTSNTHTTYNNKIDKGIYVGMFEEGMDTPGQALLRGKLYMFNVFGNDYYTQYHYKVYCILGDPSIHIWKNVPLNVNVSYPQAILVGPNQVEVVVTYNSNGSPVENARVCITGDDVFTTAISGPDGIAYVELSPEVAQTLTITVTGGTVIPFQGSITVDQPVQLVEPDGNPVIVDIDGNTDGLINPNENATITYALRNWGSQVANNIQATLTSTATNFVEIVTTTPVSFGNIAPGGSVTGDPFQVWIKPDCPVGQIIPFQLNVSGGSNTWTYDLELEIRGCDLVITNFLVEDDGSPNMNYRMDPGETVKLVLALENIGEDVAPNVIAVLSSNDPYITIEDPNGTFGTLDLNGQAINIENYFVVSVDPSCPTNYMASYSLHMFTQYGNYPYQKIADLEIPVSKPIPGDYTGPDAYGYYAYASTDAFYDQTPTYDWAEIQGPGTIINVPGVSDYTTTVTLPFGFKYYGLDYSQIRISTDGWIAFGGGTQTAPVNFSLPHNDNVVNMAAAFWDDLYDIETIEGNILYYSDITNHRFIIEWDSIAHNDFGSEPKVEIFQAILLDPDHYPTASGDGEIIFQYKKVDFAENNTVGIENSTQDIGLQYVFNNEYDPTAAELVSEIAIKFTTEAPDITIITSIDDKPLPGNTVITDGYGLDQNYPNPFTTNTWINYTLPANCNVSINIYNFKGELVRTLQNGNQSAGQYSLEWNGLNNAGNQVSTGLYFCRLQTDEYTGTMKMFRLK